jgi:anti-sigma factor ChrR (cupin superfamily)
VAPYVIATLIGDDFWMKGMNLNADYSQRVVLNHHDVPWIASPQSGVERRLLERSGNEVAKTTSIVRYQPGARFQPHHHDFGEEILVSRVYSVMKQAPIRLVPTS